MEIHNFVLYCTLFTSAVAFTLPDVFQYYQRGNLSEIAESSACECKNGKCVTDNRGKTKCICPPKFSLQGESICEKCDCGSMGKCIFIPHAKSAGSVSYEKKCLCDTGSAEKDGICVDCHCGENSKCEFEDDEKICYCLDNYAEKDGVCTECDCGFFGQCSFRNGEKVCECDENYLEHNGACELDKCVETCGIPHNDATGSMVCEGGPFGNARCICKIQEEAFNEPNKLCEKCNCGEPSKGCQFEAGKKICNCIEGYAQKFDACTACDCGEQSTGCDFKEDKKICHCREGYVQKGDVCSEKCGEHRMCQNGGYCDGGICICRPGTLGEFCEIISDCDHLCPKYTNINCSYDILEEKAYCKCLIPGMGYHPELKDCRTTCRDDSDCRNGGMCVDSGKSKFCSCLEGTDGDLCEQVLGCVAKDCGELAECVYEVKERIAVCKCVDDKLVFDNIDYTCKVKDDYCDKEIPHCRKTNGLCVLDDSKMVQCQCPEHTIYDETEKGCTDLDEYCEKRLPECLSTKGKCILSSEEVKCECPEHSVYEYGRGCEVTEDYCKTELEGCENNGGVCKLGKDEFDYKPQCECPENSIFVKGIGCEVTGDYCKNALEGCEENGGVCKLVKDESGYKVKCECPENSNFVEGPGCKVTEDYCKTELEGCENSGGVCKLGKDESDYKPQCECPKNSIFVKGTGCEVPKDVCTTFKPKCLETKGACVLNDNHDVHCVCPDGFAYEKTKGCKGICRSSSDCMHGGVCIETENKFCECLEGTEGDLCELVPGCESMDCGYDAKCEYSIWRRAAVCQCFDDQFAFDLETKKCKRTCIHASDCLNGGTCTESKSSGSKFCECLKGTEGDLCEKISVCEAVDCGYDARCIFDVQAEDAVCVCNDKTQSFDLVDRTCKKSCVIDGGCENGGECAMQDSHNYLCKCPEGTSGNLCEVVDECMPGKDKCKGDDSVCAYDIEQRKAVCICKNEDQRYDPLSETCKLPCTTDSGCQNGGLCMNRGSVDRFCVCKEGVSGDLCEKVDLCQTKCGNGDEVLCKYDSDAGTAECLCKDAKSAFDAVTKTCKTCDCGGKEISCDVEDGKVVCVCPEGFSEVDGKCKKQWCTEKKCSHGKCEVIMDEEICSCYDGYILDGDECKKINCMGKTCLNGTCIVRRGGFEECICPAGYTLRGDTCIRGVCRMNTCFGGRCQIIDGELTCVCPERYDLEGVGCFETVCKIQRCFGGKCVVKNGEEICTCPDGYILQNDVCKKILCEKKNCFGGKCHITDGVEECVCPDGYSIYEDVCRRNI